MSPEAKVVLFSSVETSAGVNRFYKFIFAVLLLPLTLASLYHLPLAIFQSDLDKSPLSLLFLGAVVYIVFENLFSRPMRTYVFGHELSHALASWFMGGKVHAFHVSEKGGSVSLSKTNFLVALAPYCLPIYTIFTILLYWVLQWKFSEQHLYPLFLLALGFTLAFHASLTLFAIRQEQPDIEKTGFFFSIIFILLVNAWVLTLILKMLWWNDFSLKNFFLATMKTQLAIWKWLFSHAIRLLQTNNSKLKNAITQ